MSTSTDKLVEDYLDHLERELADFPSARRRELVQEISEHIAEARAGLESESEADIRNLLDRMGDPSDIAAEAREVPPEPAAAAAAADERRAGAVEIGALVLLLIGGLALPLALGFLATSSASCVQVPIGGAPNPIACSSGGGGAQTFGTVVMVLLAAASVATVAYLARRMNRNAVAVPV
jgi:uncharacterized membrane protein YphA (DoxX/SURF4 family)